MIEQKWRRGKAVSLQVSPYPKPSGSAYRGLVVQVLFGEIVNARQQVRELKKRQSLISQAHYGEAVEDAEDRLTLCYEKTAQPKYFHSEIGHVPIEFLWQSDAEDYSRFYAMTCNELKFDRDVLNRFTRLMRQVENYALDNHTCLHLLTPMQFCHAVVSTSNGVFTRYHAANFAGERLLLDDSEASNSLLEAGIGFNEVKTC